MEDMYTEIVVDRWSELGSRFSLLDGGGGFYRLVASEKGRSWLLEFDHLPSREEAYSKWVDLVSMADINRNVV